MIVCRALEKTYRSPRGSVHAVRGIDLEIEAGRFAAIVGRSGSGKSSLMAMIGGLSRPTAGDVVVDATRLWSLSEIEMARFRNRRIAYVFQFSGLLPTLSAVDNVALPALIGGLSTRAEANDRAGGLLADLGLAAHGEALPSEMSAGEQRRVAIARALINEPVLLLADEPTSDLDEETEREVMSVLRAAASASKATLILVTHNLALAGGADTTLQMADGKVVA